MTNATTIVGWAYEADTHCNDCADYRFKIEPGVSNPGDFTDSEGNTPAPIFSGSGDATEECYHCKGEGLCIHDNLSHTCGVCDGNGYIPVTCGDCGELLEG